MCCRTFIPCATRRPGQLSAGIALPAIRAQREHSIWSRPPPSSPSRYSHSCSWSSCSRQARTTIARDTSTIPMNVGRDERVRPADALGPMAALPTSTSRPSCPQTILWAQCLHAGSLLPAFLAFLVAFLVASACHRLHHTRRTAEGTAEVLVFTARPAPPPPVPPCGRDTLLGGIVLGRHERFTNRFHRRQKSSWAAPRWRSVACNNSVYGILESCLCARRRRRHRGGFPATQSRGQSVVPPR